MEDGLSKTKLNNITSYIKSYVIISAIGNEIISTEKDHKKTYTRTIYYTPRSNTCIGYGKYFVYNKYGKKYDITYNEVNKLFKYLNDYPNIELDMLISFTKL